MKEQPEYDGLAHQADEGMAANAARARNLGLGALTALSIIVLPSRFAMSQALPKVTRENAAEAAKRLAAARKTDRDGVRTAYVPPDTIDGVPWRSFAELLQARFSPSAKRDRRLEGRLFDDVFPLKNIRSMFMTAYSPNQLELTDAQIFSFFREHVVASADAFKLIHHGPGRDLYIVTKKGELAILHIYLGPGGFLLYQGQRYDLIYRRTPAR
jgi:hypothetical protein